jgi:hypothetical protein
MIYLITYETNNTLKNYSGLRNSIKSSGSWWHYIKNTWIIRTDKPINFWYNKLSRHLAENDRIMVVEIKSNYQGWLDKGAWEWLKKQFEKEN